MGGQEAGWWRPQKNRIDMENVEKFQGIKIFEILNLLSSSDVQMILDSKKHPDIFTFN